MKQLKVIKCLVISPQDVQAERVAVAGALERWNGQIGNTVDTLIHAVRWETHSTPELGGSPQALLNKQIVEDCDCAVAVFWSRLGTPTENASSGSIEEINEILARGGHVLVYICKRDIPQAIMDHDQLKRLKAALDTLRKKGIVFEYQSPEELQMLLMGHLTTTADKILAKLNGATQGQQKTGGGKTRVSSSLPEVRVKTAWGLPTGMGPDARSVLSVEIQNLSSQPVHFKSICIELSNGEAIAPVRGAFGTPISGPTKLDPGASLPFYLDFAEFLEIANKENSAKLRRVIVTDQIDRQFYSSEKDMEIAISNYKKWISI